MTQHPSLTYALLLTVSPVMVVGRCDKNKKRSDGVSITAKALSACLIHFFYPSKFEFAANQRFPFFLSSSLSICRHLHLNVNDKAVIGMIIQH